MRKNDKVQIMNYENTVFKSNELSMAQLNHGLSLNQMQLLAFAIYCTQQDGITKFNKADFEKKFELSRYKTKDAYKDVEKILDLKVATLNIKEDSFKFWNCFSSMSYDKGLFSFEWNSKMLPHILNLKEKYISIDLGIASKFKSSFTWTLYEYLKAHYGYLYKEVSKEELLKIFGVEGKKTYTSNTAQFKRGVLDVAIGELNTLTEFDVSYEDIKVGRNIVAFKIIWSTGKKIESATIKQLQEIKNMLDIIFADSFKYLDLNDSEKRKRAYEILEELKTYLPQIEGLSCISKKQADTLISKIKVSLKELESNLEINKKPKPPTYNWLDKK